MNITDIYSFFNLTQNEQTVYEAFLKYGESLASDISIKINMDKSSTYNAVSSLVLKKLLYPTNNKKRGNKYIASNPEIFKQLIKEKELEVEKRKFDIGSFINYLKEKALKLEHSSYISIEHGYEAHEKAMRRTLKCKEKVIRMKTNMHSPLFDDQRHINFMKQYYFKQRIKKKIYLKQMAQYQHSYPLDYMNITDPKSYKEFRIMPDTFGTFDSFKIYDNYVDITVFDDGKDITMITICDENIANLMKEFFDFTWSHSTIFYGRETLPSLPYNNKLNISRIGMGTRGIGAWDSAGKVYTFSNPYYEETFTKEALSNFLSNGVNYIDLCLKYANGRSVQTVSNLIKNYPRERLVISGKLTRINENLITKKGDIEKQCDMYLKILNTNYLDFFQIHSPNISTLSIEEIVKEIEKLIDKGKVKNLSVGNFETEDLKRAIKVSKTDVKFNEIPFNLFEREYEKNGTIDFCINNKVKLIFVRALALGRLCGLEEDIDIPLLFKDLTIKYNKTSAQIVLNWVLNKYPRNSIILIKSEIPAHIKEDIEALKFKLDDKDFKALDKFHEFNNLRLEGVRIKK